MVNRKDHPNETPEKREKREILNKFNNERLKNSAWYCEVCKNGKNYTLRGKGMHLRTKKHNRLHTILTTTLIQF